MIRHLRLNAKGRVIGQAELGSAMKTTPNTVCRWENGTYRPSFFDINELATYFSVPISQFVPGRQSSSSMGELIEAASCLSPTAIHELTQFARFRRTVDVEASQSKLCRAVSHRGAQPGSEAHSQLEQHVPSTPAEMALDFTRA
jgi:transcriptional regulator with XRE-family HTH domain